MDFVDWSISVKIPIIYLTICITIPSMALYMAEIVTIVRHKKFHNSFYALFVMRAIPDLLYVLNSFYDNRLPSIIGSLLYPIYSHFPNWMFEMTLFIYGSTFQANNLLWRKFLPFITIIVLCVPTFTCWPAFKFDGINKLNNPNSTTDRNFIMTEAGDAPYLSRIIYVDAVFSVIFMGLCILLNICTFVAYKLHVKKVSVNGNNFDDIERKLLIYAMATFFGHVNVACLYLMLIIININDPKTRAVLYVYNPLIIDTGTVMLSSCLLLWASGTFRQQLIKNFLIIRIRNNRVAAMEGPRNNNHRPAVGGGAVGPQFQNRIQ
uniref:Serpentine receptor class gamma n=1 Tax=Globodera rostochiensis TaxID=31243 RepID=A0A914HQB5_GLORO